MTALTLASVAEATPYRPLTTLDTVAMETLAWAATSSMVTLADRAVGRLSSVSRTFSKTLSITFSILGTGASDLQRVPL
jgi:hypothetical protein